MWEEVGAFCSWILASKFSYAVSLLLDLSEQYPCSTYSAWV
jgi:hypothetical protein